jgi:hypothetical protein
MGAPKTPSAKALARIRKAHYLWWRKMVERAHKTYQATIEITNGDEFAASAARMMIYQESMKMEPPRPSYLQRKK